MFSFISSAAVEKEEAHKFPLKRQMDRYMYFTRTFEVRNF
jgi:hypothetical protein